MNAEKTLMITNETVFVSMDPDLAGLFGDNGGDPDGSLWLPSMPIDEEDAAEIIAAGHGEMVNAFYYANAEDVAEALASYRFLPIGHFAMTNGAIEPSDAEDAGEIAGLLEKLAEDDPSLYYECITDALNAAEIEGWAGYGSGDVIAVIWK